MKSQLTRSAQVPQFGVALSSIDASLGGKAAPAHGEAKLPADAPANAPAGLERKIIYSASVDLVVEDFAGFNDKVASLAKQFDAYVADSNLTGSTGETHSGTWKIRVPQARFDEFVAAAKGLGELVSVGTSSKDVSEEYYDVDARIRNKTKEEERLLKLLEERPGKLADVIAIERELSRVREELERMQGRMRVLANLTSLTTVDLQVTEIHDYKPADAPGLGTRIRRAFAGSLEALASTGATALVALAAITPWLPLVALILGIGYPLARSLRRHAAHATDLASGGAA